MTAAAPASDRASREREIIAAANFLFPPGSTVEIRAPKAGRERTLSGYSSDPLILAKMTLSADRKAAGVYWTLNSIDPKLKARSADKLKPFAEHTTTDADVLIRHNLLLDIDPVRPSGISSCDSEHELALDLAWVIRRELMAVGWPEPLVMDSGNGAYLIFHVDLPNSDESLALVKAVLAAIGARFNTDRVKIDPSTCNASRIAKVPATTAMKGDSTDDRPHRVAQVLDIPKLIQPVPLELLQSMAATATEEPKAKPKTKSAAGARAGGKWIDTWLQTSGLEILDGPKAYQGGRRWHIQCPWNEDHGGTSAAILERPGGELAFKCLHESCAGYGWAELRQLKEPGHRERNGRAHSDTPEPPADFPEAPWPEEPGGQPQAEPGTSPSGKPLETIDALTIFRKDYPEPVFVIPGLLMRGVTFFCGRPKIGKSWLALQLALAVARATKALGKFSVERTGKVLYCGLEESPRRTGNRLKKFITAEEPFLQNIEMVYRLKPLLAGGAAELDAYLRKNPCELVIIDTYLAVVQAGNGKRDVLRSDYNEVKILTELAEKHQTAILVVHHLRKMGAEYALDAVAGTTGLTAGCDAIWALTRTPEGTYKLAIQGRDMANPEFELKFNGEQGIETKGLTSGHTVSFGWHVLAENNEIGMSQERKDILLVLEQEGRFKPSGIARLLGNKNVIAVRRLLQKMVADNLVTKDGNGRYWLSDAFARAHKIPGNGGSEREGAGEESE